MLKTATLAGSLALMLATAGAADAEPYTLPAADFFAQVDSGYYPQAYLTAKQRQGYAFYRSGAAYEPAFEAWTQNNAIYSSLTPTQQAYIAYRMAPDDFSGVGCQDACRRLPATGRARYFASSEQAKQSTEAAPVRAPGMFGFYIPGTTPGTPGAPPITAGDIRNAAALGYQNGTLDLIPTDQVPLQFRSILNDARGQYTLATKPLNPPLDGNRPLGASPFRN
jgi:hypothetical protein